MAGHIAHRSQLDLVEMVLLASSFALITLIVVLSLH